MFEYYRDKLSNNGIRFLQDLILAVIPLTNGVINGKAKSFFSHDTTNSCGVAIGYLDSKNFVASKMSHDTSGRILIVEANIDDETFILINFYNSNTESMNQNKLKL